MTFLSSRVDVASGVEEQDLPGVQHRIVIDGDVLRFAANLCEGAGAAPGAAVDVVGEVVANQQLGELAAAGRVVVAEDVEH